MAEQEKTEGCGVERITAADIVDEALGNMHRHNPDGPEAIAAGIAALNDMAKAGAVPVARRSASERVVYLLGRPGAGMVAPAMELATSITVVTEDVLAQRNAAWERLSYLEAVVANMPNAASVAEMLEERDAEITRLRHMLIGRPIAVEQGSHDYHGPLGKPDDNGRRVPVTDPVHEQFHRAVGDVLAGKVMPAARRQMQEALKSAPKEATTIPTNTDAGDQRRIGWRGEP